MDAEKLALSAVYPHVDEFTAMSDRELLEHVARKIKQFEHMAGELMTAVEKNPMAKMLIGKMGGGIFG